MIDDRIKYKFGVDANGLPCVTAFFVGNPKIAITRHFEREVRLEELMDSFCALTNDLLTAGDYVEEPIEDY